MSEPIVFVGPTPPEIPLARRIAVLEHACEVAGHEPDCPTCTPSLPPFPELIWRQTT